MYVEIADTFEADHNYASLIFSDDFYTAIWTGSTGSSVPGYNFLVIDTLTDVVNSFPGLTAPTLTNAVTEDATTADFSLLATSSCINKGINTGVLAGSIDYAGNSRIYGSAIDIGAYEWKPALTAINSALPAARINAYPNPATDLIIISTPKPNGILQIIPIRHLVKAFII